MGWELQMPTGDVFKVTGTATIGRAPNNHVVINDTLASRQHVELRCEAGALIVKDRDSTNGTYINEVPISYDVPYVVQPGDTLRIGDTKIRVHYADTIRRPLLPKPAQVINADEPRNLFSGIIDALRGMESKK
jgi:pSer/pThr/pTyr-binding forkhead associated (FHA) protein